MAGGVLYGGYIVVAAAPVAVAVPAAAAGADLNVDAVKIGVSTQTCAQQTQIKQWYDALQ